MSRTTTTAFNTAIAQTVTSVGYLVEIDFGGSPTEILRWCDLGNQTYAGYTWTDMDMAVQGFQAVMEGLGVGGMTLDVQNLDSAIVQRVLNNVSFDTSVRVWQIAREVGSPSDAPQLADMVSDGTEIGLDRVRIKLIPRASRYSYAPRKRCDASSGFNNATPIGTKISWGGEVYVIGGEDNIG
jgi:hypothetical protein